MSEAKPLTFFWFILKFGPGKRIVRSRHCENFICGDYYDCREARENYIDFANHLNQSFLHDQSCDWLSYVIPYLHFRGVSFFPLRISPIISFIIKTWILKNCKSWNRNHSPEIKIQV